jgi:hypothetical protein
LAFVAPHWASGAAYHSTFAEIFECLDERGVVDIRSKCSFVELLCWPATRVIPQDHLLDLFQGDPTNPRVRANVQANLRGRFCARQARHRQLLSRCLSAAEIIFVPHVAFDLLCHCQDDAVAPEIVAREQDVNEHFQAHHNPHPDWWIFDSGHRAPLQLPRLVVTKRFPWLGRQPAPMRREAIERIRAIIAGNEAARWIQITGLSAQQLRRAAGLKERIEPLQEELTAILGGAD